jgi:hypothetical protein
MYAYQFCLRRHEPIPGKPGWYKVPVQVVVAKDVVEAEKQVTEPWWTWMELGPRCNACKGVWHEATGHLASENVRWCGPCTRDFVAFLVQQTRRRWGGMKFYELAVPPVGDTSGTDNQ